jgi:hypothetical protein
MYLHESGAELASAKGTGPTQQTLARLQRRGRVRLGQQTRTARPRLGATGDRLDRVAAIDA